MGCLENFSFGDRQQEVLFSLVTSLKTRTWKPMS